MGVVLVNGDGNPAVYAAQDSDLLGGISGQATGILDINDKFSATIADANTVEISSGVCITKEGRRIQIDVGDVEEVIVPTGSQGTTKYYIIGFHLYTDVSGNQLAETFIDEVESSTATITENMFKDGETEVYVSLYRITRNGLNLEDLTLILPEIPSLGDLKDDVEQINTELSDISNYSTSEKIIGKWFGQTLYRKCFTATPTSLAQWFSDMVVPNATLVKLYGKLDITSGTVIPLPYVSAVSSAENIELSYNASSGMLFRTGQSGYLNYPITIVFEYVKTN